MAIVIAISQALNAHTVTSTINLSELNDDFVILKVFERGSNHKGVDVVFVKDSEHGYLVDVESAKSMRILHDNLTTINSSACGDCYSIKDIGVVYVNLSDLTGVLDVKPDVAVGDIKSLHTYKSPSHFSTEPSGWANINSSVNGVNTQSATFTVGIDGSQTIFDGMGNFDFSVNYDNSYGSQINSVAYNHSLDDDNYELRLGRFGEHNIRGVTNFYGMKVGTAKRLRDNVEYYDSYEFDIKIEGPGSYRLYNNGVLIDDGYYDSNRFKLQDIRNVIDGGLELEVIDRHGKKHIFNDNRSGVTSLLKPYTGFWQASVGYDADKDSAGVGLETEYGLPLGFNINFNGSLLSNSDYYANTTLIHNSELGEFDLSALSSQSSYSDGVADSTHKTRLKWGRKIYDANVGFTKSMSGADTETDWSGNFDYTFKGLIGGSDITSNYEYRRAFDGSSTQRLNLSSQYKMVSSSLSFAKSTEVSFFANINISFGGGYSTNVSFDKNTIRGMASYQRDGFGITGSSSISEYATSHSLNLRNRGRYGSFYASVSDSGNGDKPINFSASSGLAWQDGYIDIIPQAKDSTALITTDFEDGEKIHIQHEQYDYTLDKGYVILPVTGDAKNTVYLSTEGEDEVITLKSDSLDLTPRKYYGDHHVVEVVSGGAMIFSERYSGVKGVIRVDDRSYVYHKGYGAFIEGLKTGTYTIQFTSGDSGNCNSTIELSDDFREYNLESLFDTDTCELEGGKETTLTFKFNESTLTDNDKKTIENFVKRNKGSKFSIEGHSCSIGSEAAKYNVALKRANFAKEFMVKIGVPQSSISTASKSDKMPLSSDINKQRAITIRIKNEID